MNKTKVYDLEGNQKGKVTIPEVFQTEITPSLIKRAVIALQSHKIQPQGRDLMAGKRTSAEGYGVGRGLSRVPRVKGERYRRSGQAAFAPNTVKGRITHPPYVNKIIKKKINKKERIRAIRSAIAATANKDYVIQRGHRFKEDIPLPIVVTDDIQQIQKTQETKTALQNLGVWIDVERVMDSAKIRAGRGKMRGRGKKHRIGPLLVVNEDQGIVKAARNISGVHVVKILNLNSELLAPGTHPGRLTIWSESAIKTLEKIYRES